MIVVPPWLLACALSLAWTWATGSGDTASTARTLFLTRSAFAPALVLLAAVPLVLELHRRGRLRADQWPVAGGFFAALAFLAVLLLGATWGDGYSMALMTAWSLLSGYVLFVFAFGSRAWYRAFR
jgi:hypothetical protein